MTRWQRLLIAEIILAMAAAAWLALSWFRDSLNDHAAEIDIGHVLCKYVTDTKGDWPRGWEDLRRSFDTQDSNAGASTRIAFLREHVEVNFDVDPAEVARHPVRTTKIPIFFRTRGHPDRAAPGNKEIWFVLREYHNRSTTNATTHAAED